MLHLWIEVATESKTALGNMYGFAGLMYGLCMPQVFLTDILPLLIYDRQYVFVPFNNSFLRRYNV